MRVDVVVTGDEQAASLFRLLGQRLEDGTPRLRSLVDLLLDSERERFMGGGIRWKPLARSTLARDRRGGRDPRPMIQSGRLMRSLTVRGAPGQILRVTPTTLTFGTSVHYARYHQKGIGEPRRTVLGLTRVQRKAAVAELRQLLLEGVR